MANLGQILKQAQQLQTRMSELQEQLGDLEVTGTAGGDMVRVTLNGRGEARAVKIDPTLAGPDEVEVLEDLVVAAINDAKAKVDSTAAEKMSELTGGLQLPPGMKLPF